MECNKEEAIRAKGIAEKKMESKDFVGALKIANKAQRLYPDLENIGQMISVCDVHCSAENKNLGTDKDWYSILKVEQSADDMSIRKQYRKLALLLHPDKNKFPGAQTAFMLIGEAQKVLLDRQRRTVFDIRYSMFCHSTAPNPSSQAHMNANNVKPPSSQKNVAKNTSSHAKMQPQKQAPSGVSRGTETFWTACPFCTVKFRYYKTALNKDLVCQSCKKNFIAYEICAEPNPKGSTANQTAAYARAGVPNQGVSSSAPKGKFQGNSCQQPSGNTANQTAACAREGDSNQGRSCSTSKARFQECPGQQKSGVDSFAKSGQSKQAGRSKKTNDFNMATKNINRTSPVRTSISNREKKQVAESGGSFQPKGSNGSKYTAVEKGGAIAGSGSGVDIKRQRSSQSKRDTSFKGIESDDDTSNASKRFKSNVESSSATRKISPSKVGSNNFRKPSGSADEIDKSAMDKPNENESVKESDLQRSCKVDKSDSSLEIPQNKVLDDVPDSEFNDFNEIRNEENFRAGQVWAVYDTLDAMPRFYVQIKKVFSSGFKLRITWLEPDPDEKNALQWADNELPISCGKFKLGGSDNTDILEMFSHPICWEKGSGKGSIRIYPKKDETWALFSDWCMDWMSDAHNKRKYEYEFVEILSDYDESVGVHVAFLGRLKGFTCLFSRKGRDVIQIPPSEYLRFSHRVPSYTMTGEEKEGVPKGSFELDPAAITFNLKESPLPEEMKPGMATGQSSIADSGLECLNPGNVVKEKESGLRNDQTNNHDKRQSNSNDVAEHVTTQDSNLEVCELPEHEFFNFDATRELDVFQVGQMWALYGDEDGLPKYYGQIKKVYQDSEIKLRIAWLEADVTLTNDLIVWRNREMPICCGKFKIKSRKLQSYYDSSSFSHQLRVETLKSNVFEIYPRKGEVWALYKKWNVDMIPSDLETCEYEVVDVVEENSKASHTKVLILEHVPGYKFVFKAKMSGSSLATMEIPHNELLKFSHQIPCHNLTEEKDGSLRGYKELDSSALPPSFFLPKVR